MIFRIRRRWVIVAGVLSAFLIVGYSYQFSEVWYRDYCSECGKERAVIERVHFGVFKFTNEGEVRTTPVSEAIASQMFGHQDHQWSRWLSAVRSWSFFGGENGRGIGPRMRFDPVISQELATMPAGPEVWRKLLALEKDRPLHFRYMLVEELSNQEEFSLQEWWKIHETHVKEVLLIESDKEAEAYLRAFLDQRNK